MICDLGDPMSLRHPVTSAVFLVVNTKNPVVSADDGYVLDTLLHSGLLRS